MLNVYIKDKIFPSYIQSDMVNILKTKPECYALFESNSCACNTKNGIAVHACETENGILVNACKNINCIAANKRNTRNSIVVNDSNTKNSIAVNDSNTRNSIAVNECNTSKSRNGIEINECNTRNDITVPRCCIFINHLDNYVKSYENYVLECKNEDEVKIAIFWLLKSNFLQFDSTCLKIDNYNSKCKKREFKIHFSEQFFYIDHKPCGCIEYSLNSEPVYCLKKIVVSSRRIGPTVKSVI